MTAKATVPRKRFLSIFRAALVPWLIACFTLALLLSGCAALDEAAVARTDRLPEAPFYKSYRKAGSLPEPALVLPLVYVGSSEGENAPLEAFDVREDVPGAPLAWQVAADQLLWNLLRRCS